MQWTAYISSDTVFDDPGDTLIDSGTISSLNGGAVSASIDIDNGGWPSVSSSTDYYLIVDVYASDEIAANTGNNNSSSTAVTVSPTAPVDVDYLISSLPSGGSSAVTGDTVSDTFTIENTGTADGSQNVYWTVYRSDDNTLETATDIPIDTGSIGFLNAGQTSGGITFTGTWPDTAGSYYLIVSISAGEDSNNGNDVSATSSAYTINDPDIDYEVTAITAGVPSADVESAISETFQIQNTGTNNGSEDILWFAYISDNTVLDGNETIFDSGTNTSLDSGVSSSNILLDGNWPDTSGTYYIILSVFLKR